MDVITKPKDQQYPANTSARHKRNTFGLIIIALVILIPLAGTLTSSLATTTSIHTTTAAKHNYYPVYATPVATKPISDLSAQMTTALAKSYMNAFLISDYGTMWSLLHPSIQTKWPNRAAFSTFWKLRFAPYIISGYTLGHAQTLASWVDPETMRVYNHLNKISVSLSTQLNHTLPTASLPPEDVRPAPLFQNLPFIVQHILGSGENGGRWSVLVAGPTDTEAPLLPPITPVARSVNVPILMYHHISDSAPYPNPRLWTVTIERFSAQLDYLQAHGYHSITFNQLFNALYYKGPLPDKPIIFTFDDGLEDSYQQAYPILRAHYFSGMFYIVSGKVGWDGQMTWPQLREMLAHGMQMGAHTIHHVNLASVLLASQEQSQQELQIPPIVMRQQLGIVIQHFCYPYGEPFYRGGRYQRQQVLKMLPANGYIDATVAVGSYSGITQTSTSPFTLPRVPVFGFENLAGFAATLPWI